MKPPLPFASNFPLTIRRLADRQKVSEASVEAGNGQAYFPSLNLFRRVRETEPTNLKGFYPEQVLCSLSAGSKVTLKCERVSDFATSRDCQHSGNKERVFCSLSAAVISEVGILQRLGQSCEQIGEKIRKRIPRLRSECQKSNPQHSENKETIGPSNGREDRSAFEKMTAHPRVFKKAVRTLSEGPLTSPWPSLHLQIVATHSLTLKRGEGKGGRGVRLRGEKHRPPMTIDYLLTKRTNGANPFKIFEALEKCDQQALSQIVRRLKYSEFLTTAYWFAVSTVAKSRAGMRCQVCNSGTGISVHHRTYDTHGREHENMYDLVVLCDNCHGLFHGHVVVEFKHESYKAPKLEVKRGRLVEYTQAEIDALMPPEEIIVLNKVLINRCRANGSFTNATLRAFGLKKPLIKGWVSRLCGTVISRESYHAALEGKFHYNTGPLEKSA